MDPKQNLIDKYVSDNHGFSDFAGHVAKTMGVQALSGIKGLSELPHGMDAAADAIKQYQEKYGPGDLTPEGADYIRGTVAPLYNAVKRAAPLAGAMVPGATAAAAYPHAVSGAADLAGKYLGAPAAGAVGAVGEAAPYAGFPEGEAAPYAGELAGLSTEPLLADGANARTLAKEGEAARRRAQEGTQQDLYSEPFQGRQAEHEGAVALRNAPGVALSVKPATEVGHPEAGLVGYHPDAQVVDAHAPTGEHLGRLVMEPNGDMMQGRTADVFDEANRGQGIGTQMLQRGVDHAHDNGMDWGSDVKLSPAQVATYMKLQENGYPIHFNPSAAVSDDNFLTSGDGNPVLKIPQPTHPDTATPDETPTFNPNSYIGSQAFAGGGEVLGDVGALVAKYAQTADPLKGLPVDVKIPALGQTIQAGPNPKIRQVAQSYMDHAGIQNPQPDTYVKANPARGKAIAGAYDAAQHAPNDPQVKASYDALIQETLAQYQHIKDAGLKVDFIPPGAPDPYAASPRLSTEDVNKNNHMYVFPTSSGFGTEGAAPMDHPLLGDSGETISGQPATHNDIFRVVHDYFGHAKEGVGFRADGEENAWNQHAQMYSDQARPAMTSETRGQNSWVNFGPHSQENVGASGAGTVYAPQKAVVLPDVYNKPDTQPEMMDFLHMSNLSAPNVTLDPKFYGTGMKGAEAKRGGMKVTSLYPADIDPKDIEQPLQSKTPYRVSVPASSMYDMSNDPMGLRAGAPNYSEAEEAVRDAGFAGYHAPGGVGLMQGQGRLFGPTPATRIGAGPVAAPEEDLSAGFAEGGEVATGLDDISQLVAKYAQPDQLSQAQHLVDTVKDTGSATYNPTTGDIHTAGYAVPTDVNRSVALDAEPTANEVHDFIVSNQDAFANPKAALHMEADGNGNHFMHVAHVETDFDSALAAAKQFGAPGVRELHTGINHETTSPVGFGGAQPDPMVEDYLAGSKIPAANSPAELDPERNQRSRIAWRHGSPTVDQPQRVAFPGIYNDPRQVIADSNSMVGPEDPLLSRLFDVNRQDLSDIALSRQGNELGILPGAKPGGTGAASARGVMTPQNEQRLIDVLTEARGTPLHTGMTGWYSMDPLYERFRQMYGDDEAPARYAKFNTLMGMASPGSDVGTEIARGTSAHWLDTQGRFPDFQRYGGMAEESRPGDKDFPQDMIGVPGHAYHPTAQAGPMADYLRTGSMQMKSPKVPMYIGASGVPETGFQSDMPVGDAHWARGVGLADTRNHRTLKGEPITPGSSASTPEMQTLGPWWRDRVAAQAGYQAVPAQATAWGAFAPYTGVTSKIGAPKLEILSTQIGKVADRLGISPESARDLVISGQAGAYRRGGSV